LQATIDAYFNALPRGGWPVWVIGGHDKQRIASKIGQQQMRILAMLVMTLKGTPFLYMGDEIGRERVPIPPDRVHDPFEKLVKGYGLCRDPERAPMRWDETAKGGFTTGEPWLPLEPDGSRNVFRQKAEDHSILQLFRQLIALRRAHPCLERGVHRPLASRNEVLAYKRSLDAAELTIVLNLAAEPRKWAGSGTGRVLLSTHLDRKAETHLQGSVLLRGNEGVIIEIERR
jgi:alpha-glucosidase